MKDKIIKYTKNKTIDGLEGISFGITSAVITILGVLIGLAATGNQAFTEVGIIIFGLTDAISDSGAMYISEESEYVHTKKELLKISLFTFASKILTLIALAIPLFLLSLYNAVLVSIIIGVGMIAYTGYYVANGDIRLEMKKIIPKYIAIALVVAVIAYFIGHFASIYIGV